MHRVMSTGLIGCIRETAVTAKSRPELEHGVAHISRHSNLRVLHVQRRF